MCFKPGTREQSLAIITLLSHALLDYTRTDMHALTSFMILSTSIDFPLAHTYDTRFSPSGEATW